MNLNILYKQSAWLILFFSLLGQGLWAQSSYNLSFTNPKLTANPLQIEVDIMISFNAEGQLGSSNLSMIYDPEVMTNPKLISQHLSAVPTYMEPSLTKQMDGRVSLNIELLSNGSGDKIGLAGDEMKLATIAFDLYSTDNLIELKWFEEGTRGTVVFSDDPNYTLLTPAQLQDITVDPSDAPAQDLILKAIQVGLDAQLEWEDVAVVRSLDYEVERSIDSDLFEIIATVDKNANQGSGQPHSYVDAGIVNALEGSVFYRVKLKESDGTFITSNTVELTLDQVNALNLQAFPNPIKDEVKIQWMDIGGSAEISLIDAKGKLIRSEKTEEGTVSLEWDLGKLSSGLYFLEYKSLEIQGLRSSLTVQVKN
ncbi:MAG: T9SS type A sorting domain-containing protein [Bacteroidota bacterium]